MPIFALLLAAVAFAGAPAEDVKVIVELHGTPRAIAALSHDPRQRRLATDAAEKTAAQFREDVKAIAGTATFAHEYRNLINGVAMTVPRRAIAEIAKLPYVRSVSIDRPHTPPPAPVTRVAPDDGQLSAYIEQTGADKLWARGARGQGIVVAVIDTGVDYKVPELGGCFGAGCKVIGGYDFVNDDPDPGQDPLQHGTPVAAIIAGNSPRYLGIAPEASLLAYRQSNDGQLLASMERMMDPNGDGDFSDHADIASLSVGTGAQYTEEAYGHPGDAWATAANNAVKAGVVMVIAAGNYEEGHRISNPSQAELAISVGLVAANFSGVAGGSSRGPNPGDMRIKPDVVTAGDGVWTVWSRGLREFGGTSSATPHTAGIAALLLNLHPDWTPDRIKHALMNTALPFEHEGVLTQGAGMTNAERANAATVVADPPSLSLGLFPLPQPSMSVMRTIHVTNHGSTPATYNVTATPVSGANVTVTPPSITVAPGASVDVTVSIQVASTAPPDAKSFGVGGYIHFAATSPSTESLRVPWATVLAARVTIVSDRPLRVSDWFGADGTREWAWFLDPYRTEHLVAPGDYDLLAWGDDAANGVARLVFRPKVHLDRDQTIPLNASSFRTLTLDARDEHGQSPLPRFADTHRVAGHLRFAEASGREQINLPPLTSRRIEVESLPPGMSLQFAETWFDDDARKLYMVGYPLIREVKANATLSNAAEPFVRTQAILHPTIGMRRSDVIVDVISAGKDVSPYDQTRRVLIAAFNERITKPDPYGLALFFSQPDEAQQASPIGVVLATRRDFENQFEAPFLFLDGDRIVAGIRSPVHEVGERLIIGRGPSYPRIRFSVQSSIGELTGFATSIGAAGETRNFDTISDLARPTLNTPGVQTIEVVTKGDLVPGIPRESRTTMLLDTTRTDFVPPILTSLRLKGADGEMASRLEIGGSGSLEFSVADYTYTFGPAAYQSPRADATKLSYRWNGAGEWTPLPLVQLLEDAEGLGEGILYRADLTPVTQNAGPKKFVDLRIEFADMAGNITTHELALAFSVGLEILPRRRALGHS